MTDRLDAGRALGASHPSRATPSRPVGFDHGDDLIAELERASGPSYLLDAAIHNLVEPDSRWSSMDTFGASGGYTYSLDTALTLVPESCSFDLSKDHYREGGKWTCTVGPDDCYVTTGAAHAATPALALCAAALKARAPQADTHPKDQDREAGLGIVSGGGPEGVRQNQSANSIGDVL